MAHQLCSSQTGPIQAGTARDGPPQKRNRLLQVLRRTVLLPGVGRLSPDWPGPQSDGLPHREHVADAAEALQSVHRAEPGRRRQLSAVRSYAHVRTGSAGADIQRCLAGQLGRYR